MKLVYVHEGPAGGTPEGKGRRELKNAVYFGGIYSGKENTALWEEVKGYIEREYRTEAIKKIYLQSDGGGRKELEGWVEEKAAQLGKKEQKKLREYWGYLKNNWKGIRRRVEGGDGGTESSTEGHVSHVLSARMSSRPMGWSREGADRLSRLRIYWLNGGDMLELVRGRKETGKEAAPEGECCLSAAELLSWERQHHRANGKYIEALRASVSRQTSVKVHFNAAIAGLC